MTIQKEKYPLSREPKMKFISRMLQVLPLCYPNSVLVLTFLKD